jgi:hypothetical protein
MDGSRDESRNRTVRIRTHFSYCYVAANCQRARFLNHKQSGIVDLVKAFYIYMLQRYSNNKETRPEDHACTDCTVN